MSYTPSSNANTKLPSWYVPHWSILFAPNPSRSFLLSATNLDFPPPLPAHFIIAFSSSIAFSMSPLTTRSAYATLDKTNFSNLIQMSSLVPSSLISSVSLANFSLLIASAEEERGQMLNHYRTALGLRSSTSWRRRCRRRWRCWEKKKQSRLGMV